MSLPEAWAIARRVLREEGDFLGLIDGQDRTVQFAIESDGSVWMETPVPGERASYRRSIRFEDLHEVIHGLPDTFELCRLGPLQRRTW